MNKRRRVIRRAISLVMLAVALGFGAAPSTNSQRAQTGRADPLPSWNDGAAKRGIIDFVNHDDAAREFAYGEKDNASLNAAKKHGFTVVNIESDWKTVFGIGQAAAAK